MVRLLNGNRKILWQSQTVFYIFFPFFLLLFLQLLRWVPNPPRTSAEVAGHRRDTPGRQPNAQLCMIAAVMEPRVIKTQKPREGKKKEKVQTCWDHGFQHDVTHPSPPSLQRAQPEAWEQVPTPAHPAQAPTAASPSFSFLNHAIT